MDTIIIGGLEDWKPESGSCRDQQREHMGCHGRCFLYHGIVGRSARRHIGKHEQKLHAVFFPYLRMIISYLSSLIPI